MKATENPRVAALFEASPMAAEVFAGTAGVPCWKHEPETAECGVRRILFGDNGRPYQVTFCEGWTVEPGSVSLDVWRCWDGDWDVLDSLDPTDPRFERWYAESFSHEEADRETLDYLRWALEHGEDPIGELLGVSREVEEVWEFLAVSFTFPGRSRVVFAGARAYSGGPTEGTWYGYGSCPQEVVSFLALSNPAESENLGRCYISGFDSVDQLIARARHVVWLEQEGPKARGVFTIRRPLTAQERETQVRREAFRALDRMAGEARRAANRKEVTDG